MILHTKYRFNGTCLVNTTSKKRLKQILSSQGYLEYILSDKGVIKHYLVHRIVAVYYGILESLDDPREVDHIDSNKLNNCPSNLQALSKEEHIDKTLRDRGLCRTATGTGFCVCGSKISKHAVRCIVCHKEKVRPTTTKQDIEKAYRDTGSWVKAAKLFDISDNGLRKRYKALGGDPKSIKTTQH